MPEQTLFKPNPIVRAIIDSTVERGLKEIEEDPKRSVRKLTDLGRLFSKGRFTDEIYGLVQDLLHNDDSPYYTAIERLLRQNDQRIVRNFSINLGYNGLNIGGKIIQQSADRNLFYTPWIINMRINPSVPNSMSVQEIEACISQAKPLGIYCFSIRLEGSLLYLKNLTEIMINHSDCTFFYFLPDQKLMPAHLECIGECPATMFFLKADSATLTANKDALKKQKTMLSVYAIYDDKSAEGWISGGRVRDVMDCAPVFVVLIADDTCSSKTQQKVAKYCRSARMHPVYPTLLFDGIGDVKAIDRMNSRSASGRFFEILETGDIRTDQEIITDFRQTVSLEQLLTISLPVSEE